MKYYKVISPVTIPGGTIRLNDNQAKTRAHGVKAIKPKGVYEMLTPQTFKVGEVFGLKDVSKAILPSVEEVTGK